MGTVNMIHKNKIFNKDDVSGIDFDQDKFENCKFSGLQLKFSHFKHCQFYTCDFTGAFLEATSFHNCTFLESKLSFLNFSDTDIKDCDFSSAIMEECVFEQLKQGSSYEKKKLDLTHCNFHMTILNRSAFSLCDLTDVDFSESQLKQVMFERCTLVHTNFTGCSIEGANFDSSKIHECILDMNGFIQIGHSKGFVFPEELISE